MRVSVTHRTSVETKAAEDSRTPRRFATTAAHPNSVRSWSAAVLCRFRLDEPPVPDSFNRGCWMLGVGCFRLLFQLLNLHIPIKNLRILELERNATFG